MYPVQEFHSFQTSSPGSNCFSGPLSLKPSEESKQKPGHQPVKPIWGFKTSNTAKQILPSCIDLYMQIHMIVYSARAVDIVSVCVLMSNHILMADCTQHCSTKTEWSCDKWGPLTERHGERICLNEDRM